MHEMIGLLCISEELFIMTSIKLSHGDGNILIHLNLLRQYFNILVKVLHYIVGVWTCLA